jgi:hypothetical protein
MSIAATKRVWDSSTQSTPMLLNAMLALADFADDQGLCWPSVATLAKRLRADVDYTHKLIKQLVKSGELLQKKGGGRGNCSIYAVVCGLSDAERTAINTVLQYSVIRNGSRVVDFTLATKAASVEQRNPVSESSVSETENTVPENTVPENTVFQSEKTLYSSLEADTHSSALGSAESTENAADNHHVIHDDDDDDRAAVEKKTTSKRKRPARHVPYLKNKGMFGAHLFADCDADAAIMSFDNMILDGWDVAGIVKQWKLDPPSSENVYERRHSETDQPQRSSAGGAQPTTQRARGSRTGPAVGTADYYTRRSSK